jgi:hypothetical protein
VAGPHPKLGVPNASSRRGLCRLHASHGYQLAGLRGCTVDSGIAALCLHRFINQCCAWVLGCLVMGVPAFRNTTNIDTSPGPPQPVNTSPITASVWYMLRAMRVNILWLGPKLRTRYRGFSKKPCLRCPCTHNRRGLFPASCLPIGTALVAAAFVKWALPSPSIPSTVITAHSSTLVFQSHLFLLPFVLQYHTIVIHNG